MANYQYHNGIYYPTIEDIMLYIDDGGSLNINFTGFGAIMLDKYSYNSLNRELREFYNNENLSDLHASHITIRNKSKYKRIYETAFQLLCNTFRKTNHRYLVTILGNSTNIDIISDELDSLLSSTLSKVDNISITEKYPKIFSHLLFPINNIFNRLSRCDDDIKIHTYIDRKYDFENIHDEIFSMNGNLFKGDKSLCMIVNAYLKNQLNNNCRIESLDIINASNYPILQLVDGIINFAFNYAKVVIKEENNSSETEKMKYNVFRGFLSDIDADFTELERNIKQEFKLINDVISFNSDKPFFYIELIPLSFKNINN